MKNYNNNIIEILKESLNIYIINITRKYTNFISSNIINNFISYKQKFNEQKLKNMLLIYAKQKIMKFHRDFYIWKKNCIIQSFNNNINLNSNNNYQNEQNEQLYKIFSTTCSNITSQIYTNKNVSDVNSYINNFSSDGDFGPSINNNNNFALNNSKLCQKKNFNLKINIQEGKNDNINLFDITPQETNRKEYFKIINQNGVKNDKINKFIIRQEKYRNISKKVREKIINDNEKDWQLIYTFEPKVNEKIKKLYKKDETCVHKRLYNDSIKRSNKKYQENKLNSIKKQNVKRTMNDLKIENLYQNYKKKSLRENKLRKKIEGQYGFTFSPFIINSKHNLFYQQEGESFLHQFVGEANKNKKKIIKEKSKDNISNISIISNII